jgi:hypothetical protein
MITDPKALEDLRVSWDGVRLLRLKIYRAITGSATLPGSFTVFIADAAHNLPFLQACAVLNDVLAQLRDEQHFRCGRLGNDRTPLGALVRDSEHALPWRNYPLIKEAKCCRNALAHRAKIIPHADCWRYIDAIEAELVQWGIVDAPP